MQGFITALTGEHGLSSSTFWGEITPMAPVVLILIGVAFGYNVLKKGIKGASKGKARI